jgi:hypothetical protein
MRQRHLQGAGVLCFLSITLQGCDPGHWVGVRAELKEPLSPKCIENTLHKLPEIDKVAISTSPSPDPESRGRTPAQFTYEAGHGKGLITQFQKQEGRTSFLAGVDALTVMPSEDETERIQAFNARIAIQVAEACHARFLDESRFICFPDRPRCRQVIQNQVRK